jgi:hypothetical protein
MGLMPERAYSRAKACGSIGSRRGRFMGAFV